MARIIECSTIWHLIKCQVTDWLQLLVQIEEHCSFSLPVIESHHQLPVNYMSIRASVKCELSFLFFFLNGCQSCKTKSSNSFFLPILLATLTFRVWESHFMMFSSLTAPRLHLTFVPVSDVLSSLLNNRVVTCYVLNPLSLQSMDCHDWHVTVSFLSMLYVWRTQNALFFPSDGQDTSCYLKWPDGDNFNEQHWISNEIIG